MKTVYMIWYKGSECPGDRVCYDYDGRKPFYTRDHTEAEKYRKVLIKNARRHSDTSPDDFTIVSFEAPEERS